MDTARFSRRDLLFGRVPEQAPFRVPLRPPWADADAFAARCSGCNDCVTRCPEQVLLLRGQKAEFDPSRGECTFCGECVETCTTGALHRDQPAHRHAATVADTCLPARGVVCASCRDVCPERAVQWALGARKAVHIDTDACTGCGACVALCPVQAITLNLREGASA